MVMYVATNYLGVILLFVPLIFGFYEDYVNMLSPHQHIVQSGSIHLGKYTFGNLYDGTPFEFKTDGSRLNISKVKLWFHIPGGEHFKLHTLRLLKLRNGHEKLSFTLTFLNSRDIYDLEHNFTKGWNEIAFTNLTFINRIYVTVTESDYDNLEIGEFQILGFNKYFLSCLEWFSKSTLETSVVMIHTIGSSISLDVSRIESGATCQSSTGNCRLAIKDSVNYIDDMWIPLATDKNIFIEIKFYDSYSIEEIIVKQPIENEINSIIIKCDESLIEMIVNKTSLFTSLQTELTTSFLRFLFYKRDNQTFFGLYEIKVIGRTRKPHKNICDSATSYIKSQDFISIGQNKVTYKPTSTDQCSQSKHFLR
ncbi:unnamed protein product [Dimorphilus gyrociliatus]|uniref:Uncharacterized protein n=1 Tax=Dimorphilus gyrociliatus TaxID=2664684 RepID=A0A7I8WDZ0_9ANNE|nr:unnamed protein product [Dimorphilus gyrociliatus]